MSLTHVARGELARATGHAYPDLERACENLSTIALQDLIRLIRNLKSEAQTEKRKRQRGQFWG